jgi:hypothetical protein
MAPMYRGDYIEIIDSVPSYSVPSCGENYPIVGDKGRVTKRMYGGWLKVRFNGAGELTTIRNGTYLRLVSNHDSSHESLVLEDNNMISVSDKDDDYIEEDADHEYDENEDDDDYVEDCEVNNSQIKMLQQEIAQLRTELKSSREYFKNNIVPKLEEEISQLQWDANVRQTMNTIGYS